MEGGGGAVCPVGASGGPWPVTRPTSLLAVTLRATARVCLSPAPCCSERLVQPAPAPCVSQLFCPFTPQLPHPRRGVGAGRGEWGGSGGLTTLLCVLKYFWK